MNVLFLTHRLPYAPNRGDRNRAYHLLRAMSRFASVSLFSFVHDDEEAGQAVNVPFASDVTTVRITRLRNLALGTLRLGSDWPLTHSLLDAPGAHDALVQLVRRKRPDVVVAFCSGMARFCLEPPLNTFPLVLDMVDVDSAKWALLASRSEGVWRWLYRREERTLSRFETQAALAASASLVVNDRERATLNRMVPDANVVVLQNGIALDEFRPAMPATAEPVVVFCGVMSYYPNEEGVLWFCNEVWPRVKTLRPDARFDIVGSAPSRALNRRAAKDSSIRVLGQVPSVQPYLHGAAVSVAPLRLARGIQTKVIEALAAGLPVVLTPTVLEGLPREVQPGCLTAERGEEFAKCVLDVLSMPPDERRLKAFSARLDRLTWTEQARPLEGILVHAIGSRDRTVQQNRHS